MKRRKRGLCAPRRVSLVTQFIEFAFGMVPIILTYFLSIFADISGFGEKFRDDNRFLRVDVTRGIGHDDRKVFPFLNLKRSD